MVCPRPIPFAVSCFTAALFAALVVTATPAVASDAHAAAEHAAEPKDLLPKKLGGKVEPVTEGKPAVHAAKAAPMDPLDRVRERLAEKLGAKKAPDAGNPNVLRVATHATAPMEPRAVAVSGHAAPARASAMAAAPRREPAAAAPTPEPTSHAPHWDYQGVAGPESWGKLQAEFSKCSVGTRQSPIDIRDGVKVQLDPVQFDYKPSGFRVIDNGHTVQVNLAPGNSIEVLGRRYDLLQFHFHRPSEERIGGRQFDMVAHLVHKDIDGRLAVVAVLLDRGSVQPIVQTIWNNLPLEKGEEVAAKTALDMNALLPTDRSYYTYMGSLTTPPCTEGVLWMVMKNPVPISAEQIGIFARLYPMNARPIQQVSGRLIKESN